MIKRVVLGTGLIWAISQAAPAQTPDDVMSFFGGMVQGAIIQATRAEWTKLPPTEYSCVNEALRARMSSVEDLQQRGVMPSDPRIGDLRAGCRSTASSNTETPARIQPSSYVVDHVALGNVVRFDTPEYAGYQCRPSDQFPGFTWCQRDRQETNPRGNFRSISTILQAADGTAVYINRSLEPAFWGYNEVQIDLGKLKTKYGQPTRILQLPPRPGLPNALIAVWGSVEPEQLDSASMSILASGQSPKKGILIDFLGDLTRSARTGVPVYRITGSVGYLWSASYDYTGRGHLRFLAIDPSALSAPATADRIASTPPGRSDEEPTPMVQGRTNTPLPIVHSDRTAGPQGFASTEGTPLPLPSGGSQGLASPAAPSFDAPIPEALTHTEPHIARGAQMAQGSPVFPAAPNEGSDAPLLRPQAVPSGEATRTVEVTGSGDTPELARQDATRLAVQQVAGVYIDARRRVETNMSDKKLSEIIDEKILSYTNAYVTKFDVISTEKKGGIYAVSAKVTVATSPLIKTLQDNNVPTVAFDTNSATGTSQSLKEEKTNALALYMDLLGRIDRLVTIGVGKPQVNPKIPSAPDSAWVSVPITFFVNPESRKEWKEKFERISDSRATVALGTGGRRAPDGHCNLPFVRGGDFVGNTFLSRDPKPQYGIAACFSTGLNRTGVNAECYGRSFVFPPNNKLCSGWMCAVLQQATSSVRLVFDFRDKDNQSVRSLEFPLADFPEIDVGMSRVSPQGNEAAFFDFCAAPQNDLFFTTFKRPHGAPFGDVLILPAADSRLSGIYNILLSSEQIGRVASIRVFISKAE
jgi:hypothetical protein